MGDDDAMARVTVRVPDPMLRAVDRLAERGEYPDRSECIRAGIRRELRDAGVERGDRRPRTGETLIGDGGWEPEQAGLREGETRDDDSHTNQLTEAQRALVEGDGEDDSDDGGGE